MDKSHISIRLSVAAAALSILCIGASIAAAIKEPVVDLTGIALLIWQGFFISTCSKSAHVKLRSRTRVLLIAYFVLQMIVLLPVVLLLMTNGINLGCRDCQGAAGGLILFFAAVGLIGIITFIIQVIAVLSLRKDIAVSRERTVEDTLN